MTSWRSSEHYGDKRYSADVYNAIEQWRKEQKSSSKNTKTTKGYLRNEHLVTHKFNGSKAVPKASKKNQFVIKKVNLECNYNGLDSDDFGDFIMKQAEYFNTMVELGFFSDHEAAQQQYDAAQMKRHALEEKHKQNGTLNNGDMTKCKSYAEDMKAAKKTMADIVKKMHMHYILFMGEKKHKYDNIVHDLLVKPTEHFETVWKFKQLPFMYNPTTKKVEGRAEHMDDIAPADNTDPNIKYLWKKVPVEVLVTEPRGLSMEGIKHCIRQHAVIVGGVGRAEIQRTYMRSHAAFPNDYSMSVKSFADVLIEMNKNLPLLPCYKDSRHYEDDERVPNESVALSDRELCGILLDSMPMAVQRRFCEIYPEDSLRFDLHELAKELQPLVNSLADERKQRNNSNNGGGNKNTNDSANNKGKKSGNRNNQSNKTPKNGKATKHCDRCKEHGGNPNTHNSDDCRNWNSDGTRKKQAARPYTKNLNNMSDETLRDLYSRMRDLEEQDSRSNHRHERDRSSRGRHRSSRNRSYSRSRSRSRSPY